MSAGRPSGCRAYQSSDEMRCGPCGLVWDVNDPAPPLCRRRASDAFLRSALAVDAPEGDPRRAAASVEVRVPVELPLDLAVRMTTAYEAVASESGMPPDAAMRAAWRVFLDGSTP